MKFETQSGMKTALYLSLYTTIENTWGSLYVTVNIIYLSLATIYHMQFHLVSDRCQVLY